jgi:hypothetical protein
MIQLIKYVGLDNMYDVGTIQAYTLIIYTKRIVMKNTNIEINDSIPAEWLIPNAKMIPKWNHGNVLVLTEHACTADS